MRVEVTKVKEAHYVVSEYQCWVDGIYATEEAARMAADVQCDRLSDIWQECLAKNPDGTLTVEDLA